MGVHAVLGAETVAALASGTKKGSRALYVGRCFIFSRKRVDYRSQTVSSLRNRAETLIIHTP
jgi:hypothetical protein